MSKWRECIREHLRESVHHECACATVRARVSAYVYESVSCVITGQLKTALSFFKWKVSYNTSEE